MKMRKTFIYMILPLIAFCGCEGGEEGEDPNKQPDPPADTIHVDPVPPTKVDTLSVDERPTWTVTSAIDPTQSSMTLTIKMSGVKVEGDFNTTWAFIPDESDLVASFINDDCRGVTSPRTVYDSVLAFLPVAAAETDNPDEKYSVTVRYYSSKLRHIFTVKDNIAFTKGASYGSPSEPLVLVWKK